jgi:hypothetical protein
MRNTVRTRAPDSRSRNYGLRFVWGVKKTGFRADSKRKYATAADCWARYPDNLSAICERLQGVIIENKDAIEVMQANDAPTTLHYIPPICQKPASGAVDNIVTK